MLKSELIQLRKRTGSLDKLELMQPRERSIEIDAHLKAFLASGGKVDEIPTGVSVNKENPSISIKSMEEWDMRVARANGAKLGGRKKAIQEPLTSGTYTGAKCPIDGNTTRYLSNAACVACSKARFRKRKDG